MELGGVCTLCNSVSSICSMRIKNTLKLSTREESPGLHGSAELGIIPQSERPPIQFSVRAHAWVAGSVPSLGAYERQLIDVSLPLFISLKKKERETKGKREDINS